MPYNEKTTRRPDGSKTVRKEHIDPTSGKCVKIEITEYPSTQPDFSVMSTINKKVKTTVIYPEDDDQQEGGGSGAAAIDTGFHSTLYTPVGKTTVGETKVTKIPVASIPKPTATPLKVDVPVIAKPAPPVVNEPINSATSTTQVGVPDGAIKSTPPQSSLSPEQSQQQQQQPAVTAAEGGCCIIQ
jgi:hypothetical protein